MATKKAKKKATGASKKVSKKKSSKKVAKKTAKKTNKKVAKKKTGKKKASKKAENQVMAAPIHEVVHWEIQSQSPEELHEFYREALGWAIDASNEMNYGMVTSRGTEGIDGGIGGSLIPGSRVTVYARVNDINTALQRIEERGGKTVTPRTDIGYVIFANFEDPEGNVMGLLEG